MMDFVVILSFRGKELLSIPIQAITRKDAKKTAHWHQKQYEFLHKLKPIKYTVV